MARPATLIAVGLLLLGASSAAVGQPAAEGPQRQSRGFGMGGMGGFGSAADMWGPLLRSEQVRKELELVPEQLDKLKEIGEKASARMRDGFAAMRGLRDASPEERKAKMTEFGNKARAQAEELRKESEGVLLPHQAERLKQVALQVRGVRALEDKEVQTSLSLTDEQKNQLKSLRESMIAKFRGMGRPESDEERKAQREKMQAAGKELEEKVLGILTPEQKEKFEKMKGAKLDLDMSQLFPRGPSRNNPESK